MRLQDHLDAFTVILYNKEQAKELVKKEKELDIFCKFLEHYPTKTSNFPIVYMFNYEHRQQNHQATIREYDTLDKILEQWNWKNILDFDVVMNFENYPELAI